MISSTSTLVVRGRAVRLRIPRPDPFVRVRPKPPRQGSKPSVRTQSVLSSCTTSAWQLGRWTSSIPPRLAVDLRSSKSVVYLSALTDKEEAENWLDRETDTLLTIAASSDELAMQVIDTTMRHLQTRGRWHDAGALLPAALRTAEQIGGSQYARILLHVALFRRIRGRSADAIDLYQQAQQIAEDSSWDVGQVMAVVGLGEVDRITSRQASATTHYKESLRLAEAIDDRPGQLRVSARARRRSVRAGRLRRGGRELST